jgi:hypothetical protein
MSVVSLPETIFALDAASIYAFAQTQRANEPAALANPNYAGLTDALQHLLPSVKFHLKLAFLGIDPENEGQKRFVSYLRTKEHFTVDACDYRDSYVLPDRGSGVPYQRFSSKISYLAGMVAHRAAHLVVCSDAFDLYYPLLDYVQVRGGKASLVFFRTGMEPRWHRVGLLKEDSPIQFLDLDPFAKGIIGVDLGPAGSPTVKSGLGSLKF